MNDTARHTIPRRLDDPERWLFRTVIDELKRRMQPPAQPDNAQSNNPWFRGQVGGQRLSCVTDTTSTWP